MAILVYVLIVSLLPFFIESWHSLANAVVLTAFHVALMY